MRVRTSKQRKYAGPTTKDTFGKQVALEDQHTLGEMFDINGEALQPPHVPNLYGKEVVEGYADATGKDVAGKVAPDRVSMDVALGHRYVDFQWVTESLTGDPFQKPEAERFKAGFNDDKHPDDQTRIVRVTKHVKEGESRYAYGIKREETPREARARMANDPTEREENNYHSGILNDTENHRWVTAMDVAIGQAVSLDDPAWRSLLLAMANWRYKDKDFKELGDNVNFHRLDKSAKALLDATHRYYKKGRFPDESIVPTGLPRLITSQTVSQRAGAKFSDLPTLTVPEPANTDDGVKTAS
jgi:hypothetical protein